MGIKTDVSKIIGQRFGRLTIIGDAGQNGRKVTQVLTRCDCGIEKILLLQTLKSGLVTSCGCYNREKSIKNATTHGMNRTPLHKIWKGMLPFYETKMLVVDSAKNSVSAKGDYTPSSTHASPRQHLRRGHIRRLPKGKIWVNACVVGDASKGTISKKYTVV